MRARVLSVWVNSIYQPLEQMVWHVGEAQFKNCELGSKSVGVMSLASFLCHLAEKHLEERSPERTLLLIKMLCLLFLTSCSQWDLETRENTI